MADLLIKVSEDRDAFLVLSTISDEVVAYGTAEEIVEDLFHLDDRKPDRIYPFDHSHPERRIERAQETGSSSMIGSAKWDAEYIRVHANGWVKREDLGKVYDRWREREHPSDAIDLSDILLGPEEVFGE